MLESENFQSHNVSPEHETPQWHARHYHDEVLIQRIEQTLKRYEELSPAAIKDAYYADSKIAFSKPEDVPEETPHYDPTEAMVVLPDHNPTLALAVYTTFAESLNPDDRDEIVMYLPNLARVNHDACIALWDHLVRDPDANIRKTAHDELRDRLGEPTLNPAEQPGIDESLAELHLTWRDVAYLSRAYVEAEQQPYRRYEPGQRPVPEPGTPQELDTWWQ